MENASGRHLIDNFFLVLQVNINGAVVYSSYSARPKNVVCISKAKLNIVMDQQAEQAESQGDTIEAVQKHVSKSLRQGGDRI